jgi:hypothetical protein
MCGRSRPMLAHALLPEDYDLVPMIAFGSAIFSVLLALSGWTKTAIWLGSALAVVTLLVACLQIGVTALVSGYKQLKAN